MSLHYQQFTPVERALLTLAIMGATLMQVLDITIVNVALPHMQGALSTTPDEISWILTSYLVAAAIFMPLTGYLSDRLGIKLYLIISVTGFIITSILCGAANSLPEIVFFRLLQGVFGASLVPLSQAILADIYPPAEQGMAMAIWGAGVMVGPVLGPTLGGYLTEIATWRWNFYINVPVGILSLLLICLVLPRGTTKTRAMDWLGLTFLSLAIGSLQYFLDRGETADWFDAWEIRIAAALTVGGLIGFLINSYYRRQKNVFDLAIFRDRNFTIASILIAAFGLGMIGATVILPLMLENLFNYPVVTTGLVMAPRGLAGMLSMFIAGQLTQRVDLRILMLIGITLSLAGTLPGIYYNLMMDERWIIWPLIFQGLGLGFMFVPLSTAAFATINPSLRAEAAGLFSLLRTIGSSIGISAVITVFSRHMQISWNQLGGFVNPYNPALSAYLQPLHMTVADPRAIPLVAQEVARQAQMVAFVDAFVFITMSYIVMLPFILLIKSKKNTNINAETVKMVD